MEIINYAPVIIPTLNRYEHFKRCLESLECCTGANQTEVYVGVDFPPSEKYREGWEKICQYLNEKERNNGFKKLHVIRRESNCGVGHAKSNVKLLLNDIKPKFDTYIFTEDDNEFSPCFLEFVNKCLEKYKDSKHVLKVCGYNFEMEFPKNYINNLYFSKRGCAWGTGSWTAKQTLLSEYENLDKLRSIIRDRKSYKLIKERYPRGISLIHSMLKLRKLHGDAIWEIYCTLEDAYFVMPTISKVRNYGNDGTGVHSKKINKERNDHYVMQIIDESYTFDFLEDSDISSPMLFSNNGYIDEKSFRFLYKSLVVKLDIWLLRTFNYMPKSKYI